MSIEENTNTITFYDGILDCAHPKLLQRLIEIVASQLKIKPLLVEDPIIMGRTASYIKERGCRAFALTDNRIVDFSDFATFHVDTRRRSWDMLISAIALKDEIPPLVEEHLQRIGRQIAIDIDYDCYQVLHALQPHGDTLVYNPRDASDFISVNVQNSGVAYVPLGFFVLKRPLTIDLSENVENDSTILTASIRYSVVVISQIPTTEENEHELRRPKTNEYLKVIGK